MCHGSRTIPRPVAPSSPILHCAACRRVVPAFPSCGGGGHLPVPETGCPGGPCRQFPAFTPRRPWLPILRRPGTSFRTGGGCPGRGLAPDGRVLKGVGELEGARETFWREGKFPSPPRKKASPCPATCQRGPFMAWTACPPDAPQAPFAPAGCTTPGNGLPGLSGADRCFSFQQSEVRMKLLEKARAAG